jgi:hypothetical protein
MQRRGEANWNVFETFTEDISNKSRTIEVLGSKPLG